ncbi:hypothetical protein [Microbispora sp. NPDC049125]|uniref:hypothetical protein n=1 Tax=Microbispora sp. NPDC049125 TaxID=3154929 RepID=UPI0034667230
MSNLSPRTLSDDQQIRDWLDVFEMSAVDRAAVRGQVSLQVTVSPRDSPLIAARSGTDLARERCFCVVALSVEAGSMQPYGRRQLLALLQRSPHAEY